MSELRALYQEVILDHYRSPRNYKRLEGANRKAEGYNPLCGDHFIVYLRLEDDRIADVSFEGSGCAISKASASMMSTALKGKTREEARALFEKFHSLVTGELKPTGETNGLGKLEAFAGVSEFPVRVKCASLAWHAMRSALEAKEERVSTE
ncbi:MAG: SUF system NifU family Fe-S cluster assembly protein [Bacteroidota bacterium]